jgi:hypothetical protein
MWRKSDSPDRVQRLRCCPNSNRIFIAEWQMDLSATPLGDTKAVFMSVAVYEFIGTKTNRFDLISDVPPFGRLWYGEPDAISNAIGYELEEFGQYTPRCRSDTRQ